MAAGPAGEDNREGEWAFRPKQGGEGFLFLFYFTAISKAFEIILNFGSKPLHMLQNACKTMLLHLIMNFNLIKNYFPMFS